MKVVVVDVDTMTMVTCVTYGDFLPVEAVVRFWVKKSREVSNNFDIWIDGFVEAEIRRMSCLQWVSSLFGHLVQYSRYA